MSGYAVLKSRTMPFSRPLQSASPPSPLAPPVENDPSRPMSEPPVPTDPPVPLPPLPLEEPAPPLPVLSPPAPSPERELVAASPHARRKKPKTTQRFMGANPPAFQAITPAAERRSAQSG